MTIAASLSAAAHSMEYVLCIEGLGWPVDEADLAQGFRGTLLASADINSDIEALN